MQNSKSVRIFSWYNWINLCMYIWGFFGSSVVKNPRASAGDARDRFDPWAGKIPCRRKQQPTPVFLPGKSCGEKPGWLQSIGSQRAGHDWACVCVCVIYIYAHLHRYNFMSIVKVSMSDCLEGLHIYNFLSIVKVSMSDCLERRRTV